MKTIIGKMISLVLLLSFLVGCAPSGKIFSKETEAMASFYLQDLSGVTQEESAHNYEVLKGRMEILAQGKNYEIDKQDSLIKLSFPEKYLGYLQAEYLMEEFLVMPFHVTVEMDGIRKEIAREQIAHIECGEGEMTLRDQENEEIHGNRYIKLSFSEEMKDLAKVTSAAVEIYPNDSNQYPGMELKAIGSLVMSFYKAEDGDFYHLYDEFHDLYGNEDLFIYEITHDDYTMPYHYAQIYDVDWEEDEEEFGLYQCVRDQLSEDAYDLRYMEGNPMTREVEEKNINMIKARLDALKEPYAFGRLECGGFAVLFDQMPLTIKEKSLLTENAMISFLYGREALMGSLSSNYSGFRLDFANSVQNGEKEALICSMPETDYRTMKQWKEEAGDSMRIELGYERYPMASYPMKDSLDSNVLKISQLEIPEDKIDFIKELCMNPALDGYYSYHYCKKGNRINDLEFFAEDKKMEAQKEELLKIVRKYAKNASIRYRGSNYSVSLHLEEEKAYSKEFVSIMANILQDIDFGGEEYKNIYFIPADVKENERCHISFFSDELSGETGIYLLLENGRPGAAKEQIVQWIREDSYLNQYKDIYHTFD